MMHQEATYNLVAGKMMFNTLHLDAHTYVHACVCVSRGMRHGYFIFNTPKTGRDKRHGPHPHRLKFFFFFTETTLLWYGESDSSILHFFRGFVFTKYVGKIRRLCF